MNHLDPGWNFDNTYAKLTPHMFKFVNPTPVSNPKLIILNNDLANNLGLNFSNFSQKEISDILSGNKLPNGAECIAQAYAGHQFGNFTMLGDGRATILGEHITPNNERFDIQFKGSGKTPYSRGGDGRATLGSMLREYIISESMYGLKIPTTRSLAVIKTGDIVQREENLMGGILTRVALSHIRFGSFQYLSAVKDLDALKKLVNYTLKRHYPDFSIEVNPAITLLKNVIKKQISLIVDWMRVGFIHGVMNTDNMAVSGETIDYGPCAFMDTYNPYSVFSSIDRNGRYSFINQSIIGHWNISRFAETLIPLIDKDEKKAIKLGVEIINKFKDEFKFRWTEMMKKKLGIIGNNKEDEKLIKKILNWMEENKADYTNTFCNLMDKSISINKIFEKESFQKIRKELKKRILLNNMPPDISKDLMKKNNPLIIPRNHKIEESLNRIIKDGNLDLFNELLEAMKSPYIFNKKNEEFQKPPNPLFEKKYKTYCGT